jgi:hypothetical protein
MLCGTPPFPAGSIAQACHHHLHSAPPSAVPLAGPVPPQVDALLHAMLAKVPAQRPSIREVGRAFAELAAMDWTAPPAAPPAASFTSTAPGYSLESFRPPPQTAPSALPRPPSTPPPSPPPSPPPTAPSLPSAPPRRTGLYVGAGLIAAAGIAVGIYAATRPRDGSGASADAAIAPPADAPRSPDAAAEPPIDAASAPAAPDDAALAQAPPFAELNPYVEVRGVRVTRHQITGREYRAVLAAEAPDEDRPLGWVTHAQATVFCERIGGRLPTVAEWERAAGTGWGITVDGVAGPLQEWTSTVDGGLASVRGGYAGMPPGHRIKSQRDPATGDTDPRIQQRKAYGAAHLGFRCTPR